MGSYTLRLRPFTAPSKFVFQDPDTGHQYAAADKKSLFVQVINYRIQNRLAPIQALEHVLENYWCHLPENAGKCERSELKRGWMHYVKGGIALLENLFYGEANMVSPEEAEKRAKICIECPLNVFPDKHGFIRWSDNIAEASVGERKVSYYDNLGNCAGCSCPLRAKVWWKGDFKLTPEEKEMMEDANPECWQLKD